MSRGPRKFTTKETLKWTFPMCKKRPKNYLELIESAPNNEITPEQIIAFCNSVPGIDTSRSNSSRYWYEKMICKGTQPNEKRVGVISDKRAKHFAIWLQSEPEYSDMVEIRNNLIVPKLTTDMYKLWDAVYRWSDFRNKSCGHNCDNGWFRHAVRLAARYQWTILGQKANWWPKIKPHKRKNRGETESEVRKRVSLDTKDEEIEVDSLKKERQEEEERIRRHREKEDEKRRKEEELRVEQAVVKMKEHQERLESKKPSKDYLRKEDKNVLYLLQEHIHESRRVSESPGFWAKIGYSQEGAHARAKQLSKGPLTYDVIREYNVPAELVHPDQAEMKLRLEMLEKHMKSTTENWKTKYCDEYRHFEDEEEAIRIMDNTIEDTWKIGGKVFL